MKIALISTVSTPVRASHAGSVESLVWLLSGQLQRLGHDVTVFGCAGSEVPSKLVTTLPGSYGADGSPDDWMLCEWINIGRAIARSGEFDVMHCNAYLWGVPLAGACRCPMLSTMHILPYDDDAAIWRACPEAKVSAISAFQWKEFPELTPRQIIHHGVDESQFTFRDDHDGYLAYLGRFIANKGPREAIEIARKAGLPIRLAGPGSDYFEQEIAPLVDGKNVIYVGPLDVAQRDEFLGRAAALVYPLIEPEPFGLVQIESMLAGTPVIAPAIGAIPEIVTPGVNGVLAGTIDELPALVEAAMSLDRAAVRASAVRRFSAARMAQDYARLYAAL